MNHAMRLFVFASVIVRSVLAQGAAAMTLSRNPVYIGEPFLLICSYGIDNVPIHVTVEAFKNERKEGFLWCRVPAAITTGDGIFRGYNFSGCPGIEAGANNVSVSMIASPSLELDFNCTVRVTHKDFQQYTLSSGKFSLVVNVLPAAPKFSPDSLVFNENESATIHCAASNGKPEAAVELIVRGSNGVQLITVGSNMASLTLPPPLRNWHNATASCLVTNHNITNLTTIGSIKINHIYCISNFTSSPQSLSNKSFDCSAYVSGYPTSSYKWSVPPEIAVSSAAFISSPVVTLEVKAGLFNCTATNGITGKALLTVFEVDDAGQISVSCSAQTTTNVNSASADYFETWKISMAFSCVILHSFM